MEVKRAKNIIIVDLNAEIDSGWKDGTLIVSLEDDKFYRMDSGSAVEISAGGAGGGVSDGDKGDITISSSGTVWSVDTGLNANKIGGGTVDDTELGYLDGITSNIQTQLNAKQNAYHAVTTLASDTPTAANTTPVTLTGMSFSYAANSKYLIRFIGAVSSAAATTGCGFQFDVSSAVTSIYVSFHHQLANAGTLSGGSSTADNASLGVSSGVPTLNVNVPVIGSGLIITGANTGTAQLMYRSETTAVTTAKAGLTMIVEKIV